jgi:hypothetical protein
VSVSCRQKAFKVNATGLLRLAEVSKDRAVTALEHLEKKLTGQLSVKIGLFRGVETLTPPDVEALVIWLASLDVQIPIQTSRSLVPNSPTYILFPLARLQYRACFTLFTTSSRKCG